jgi:hypothetical protein
LPGTMTRPAAAPLWSQPCSAARWSAAMTSTASVETVVVPVGVSYSIVAAPYSSAWSPDTHTAPQTPSARSAVSADDADGGDVLAGLPAELGVVHAGHGVTEAGDVPERDDLVGGEPAPEAGAPGRDDDAVLLERLLHGAAADGPLASVPRRLLGDERARHRVELLVGGDCGGSRSRRRDQPCREGEGGEGDGGTGRRVHEDLHRSARRPVGDAGSGVCDSSGPHATVAAMSSPTSSA